MSNLLLTSDLRPLTSVLRPPIPRPVRALLRLHGAMGRTLKILAVDDKPSVTLSLRYVFAGPGYEVTCAEDGDAALAKLNITSDPYDVIIVDEKMPNLTGVELVNEIRKRGISGKIIVVAAHLSSETREAYERMDVHEMFSKPFNVNALRSAVDRLVT
jgi:DNA-binding response OmpR family regulator